MKEVEDIKTIIPLEWIDGPLLYLVINQNLAFIQFYLKKLKGDILVSWPGNSQTKMEIRFIGNMEVDFDLDIQFKDKIHIKLLEVPLLGPIIKGIIELIITRQVFELIFPLPNLNPESSV